MVMQEGEKLEWRSGWSPKGLPVQTAVTELERIRARDGSLRAESVLEEAIPETAPLHPAFLWNDQQAAHEYRLQTARKVVKAVRVIAVNAEGATTERPMYVAIPQPQPPQGRAHVLYKPLVDVRQDREDTARAIDHLTADLQQAQNALNEVKAFIAPGDDVRMALAIGITEALTTARELARAMR